MERVIAKKDAMINKFQNIKAKNMRAEYVYRVSMRIRQPNRPDIFEHQRPRFVIKTTLRARIDGGEERVSPSRKVRLINYPRCRKERKYSRTRLP